MEGFTLASSMTRKNRIVMNLEGSEKNGKTHYSLTAPGPIAFFNFDNGLEGVVDKFISKQVYVRNYQIPDDPLRKQVEPLWDDFISNYKKALESKTIRTIVIDSFCAVWDLLRLVRLGKLTGVLPHHYVGVNSEMSNLIRAAYGSDKDLILIHKLKKEWVDGKSTGNLIRDGFKDVNFQVQVNAKIARVDGQFILTIVDCRQNINLSGMEFANEGFCAVKEIILG